LKPALPRCLFALLAGFACLVPRILLCLELVVACLVFPLMVIYYRFCVVVSLSVVCILAYRIILSVFSLMGLWQIGYSNELLSYSFMG